MRRAPPSNRFSTIIRQHHSGSSEPARALLMMPAKEPRLPFRTMLGSAGLFGTVTALVPRVPRTGQGAAASRELVVSAG
jgi:hypothetical protein